MPLSRIDIALRQIDEWIGPGGVPGAAAVVWRSGEIVAEHYAGEAKPGIPIDETTLFALASVTKPVTAAVVMDLQRTGRWSIDDHVSAWLPEFETAGKDDNLAALRSTITIRQLLCHLGGLPEDLPKGTFRSRETPSLDEIVDRYLQLPLQQPPDQALLYSNAGYGILGRMVETVSGRDFWDVAWDSVFGPMHLQDTIARPGPALDPRIAIVEDPGNAGRPTESYNSQYWRDLGIPWGGLYGTARDLAHFAGAFLDDDSPLLDPQTRSAMVIDQLDGKPGVVRSARIEWPVAAWGLGWEVKGPKRKHWTGDLTAPETFCHFGAAGTLFWADPIHDVALAIFANRSTIHLWPFVPPRWSRLSNSVITAVT